jgi:hypothetical protein
VKRSPRDILQRSRPARVGVLVAIAGDEPSADCLERLGGVGLSIDRIVRNKLIGSIDRECLARLEQDPEVVEVEVSSTLEPHPR